MQRKVATSLGTKSHGAHERLTNLFMENVNIGLHSLRSGATTAANSDVNDGIRKKHGRWISDSSKKRLCHTQFRQSNIGFEKIEIVTYYIVH